jgi:hypothetical protein
MFVCLSSGASPRYRQDILRALAMPKASELSFRYQTKWVAPQILEQIAAGKLSNLPTLIAYIDQTNATQAPVLIPCRFGTVNEAAVYGTTVSLVITLNEFAIAGDLPAFNQEMLTRSAGTLPAWQPDGKLRGHYWLETSPAPVTVLRTEKLADWEKVVAQLAERQEFKDENSFYTFQGICIPESRALLPTKQGRYEFDPGREYEIRIYHYYPKNAPLSARLTFTSTSPWLVFTTNPVLALDSRYDLKRVRVKAGKPSTKESAVLSVLRGVSEASAPSLEFDLLILIRAIFWRTLAYGIVLGALLAGPQIVAAFSNPALTRPTACFVSAISGVLGLLAGILAAFGLKKSP